MKRPISVAIACFLLLAPRYGFAEDSLADCAAIKDANPRLACFDNLAGAGATPVIAPVEPAASTQLVPPAPATIVESAPVAATAPESPAVEPTPVAGVSSYKDLFGLENQAAVKGIKQVTSRIINDFDGWNGRTIFHLENGQVWMQKDVNSTLTWRGSSHPVATIKRKTFNSYLLKVEGTNKSVRVTRVK